MQTLDGSAPGHDAAATSVTPSDLHRQHFHGLVRMAALMTDRAALAEEIVQDAFADLVAHWDTIAPDRALAYLRTSVANRARSALRRRRTARRYRPPPEATVPSAEAHVLRAAGYEELLAGIAALPLRQRQVLVLRYYADASIADTAATLGISPAAVTTSTHRALRALAVRKDDLR